MTDRIVFNGAQVGPVYATPVDIAALVVGGEDADNLGGKLLQDIAEEQGRAVVVVGNTEYHGEKIFYPAVYEEAPAPEPLMTLYYVRADTDDGENADLFVIAPDGVAALAIWRSWEFVISQYEDIERANPDTIYAIMPAPGPARMHDWGQLTTVFA